MHVVQLAQDADLSTCQLVWGEFLLGEWAGLVPIDVPFNSLIALFCEEHVSILSDKYLKFI